MRFSLRDVVGGAAVLIARQQDGDNNRQAKSDGAGSNSVSSSDSPASTNVSNLLNIPLLNPLVGVATALLPGIESSTTSTDSTQAQPTESTISSDDSAAQPSTTPEAEVPSTEPTPEATQTAPPTFAAPVPASTEDVLESTTSISPTPTLLPLLTTPETSTSTSSSTLKPITTRIPLPTTSLRSTTSISNPASISSPTSSQSTLSTPSPLLLSQNQSSNAPPRNQTLVIALAVGITVFIVLLAAALFTLHRVFRRRRVGRSADSPPPSPLMSNPATFPGEEFSRASSPSNYLGAQGSGIAGIMGGGRTKARGGVLPQNF